MLVNYSAFLFIKSLKNNKIITTVLMLLCFPCFSEPTFQSIKLDQDIKLKKNYGYALLAINTDIDLKKLYIKGKKSFYLAGEDTKKGRRHILLALPEGNYRYRKAYFFDNKSISRRYRLRRPYISMSTEENWKFHIKAGQINYVGEFYLDKVWNMGTRAAALGRGSFRVNLINNASDALQFLEKKFPVLLRSRKVNYSGPGKDDFFSQISINNKQGAK